MVFESYRVKESGRYGAARWLVLEQCPEPDMIAVVLESREDRETQTQRVKLSCEDWKALIAKVAYGEEFWAGAQTDEEEAL